VPDLSISCVSSIRPLPIGCEIALTRRHDDDNQQNDDADDDADAHLHVLPPHLLAHAVGAAAEALRGRRKIVGLILQGVEAVAALRCFVQVVLHLAHCAVDFLLSQIARSARVFGRFGATAIVCLCALGDAVRSRVIVLGGVAISRSWVDSPSEAHRCASRHARGQDRRLCRGPLCRFVE
jgi:hypothetical protein